MIDENHTITIKTAYIAMYKFLENEYNLTKSDDIGGLLGGMSLLINGDTADPAAWSDWLNAVENAEKADNDIKLRIMHGCANAGSTSEFK
jgi:hypothetical protein